MNNNTILYEFPDTKGIVVSGDIHGDYEKLMHKCCVEYGMTDTLIIVAGDCGFGFLRPGYYDKVYQKVSKRLSKANNWIVFIRGNHDNPVYFDGKFVNNKRWKAVPDYSVIRACGHTILCVGGAISVDRTRREIANIGKTVIEGEDERFTPGAYWPGEAPVYDEAKLEAAGQYAIDTVITHTAPSFCQLDHHHNIQGWLMRDKDLLDDIKTERKVMDDICTFLKGHGQPLQKWFYAHFHESWHDEINGVNYQMLDIMELNQLVEPDADVALQNITEDQKELLKATKMEDGTSAWEYVLTKKPESQPWIIAGILACMKKGYNLNPMVVNWEARDLRYKEESHEMK